MALRRGRWSISINLQVVVTFNGLRLRTKKNGGGLKEAQVEMDSAYATERS